MSDPTGYLALVLHAHLPYVRHPEHEDFLEERWFFDAMTETYLPLLNVFEGLEDDGVEYHILLSLSPTLVSMMEDTLLEERYAAHLVKLLALAEREAERTRHDARFRPLALWYRDQFHRTLYWFEEKYGRRPAMAFQRLAALGHVEIMTCAATHAFLPLLRNDPGAVRAQIRTAADFHRETFGVPSEGLWLPECAYYPGLDAAVREAGARFFLLDTHAFDHASARLPAGVYAPLYCPSGVAAFGRDPESGKQVWSGKEGYPGHPDYREFYRDIGYDLDPASLQGLLVDGTIRCETGIKYFRITGREHKEPYRPGMARERAARDAGDFLHRRQEQIGRLARSMDRPPLVVAPYDAELFGHWWFEGPIFLDILFRKMHYDQETVKTTTPGLYLQSYPTNPVVTPGGSSWGGEGHYEFWITESNQWVYPLLHDAAVILAGEVDRLDGRRAAGRVGRALRQAARELLLAQGSDWTFILRTGTSPEYAGARIRDHLARFQALIGMVQNNAIDERALSAIEHVDCLFPSLKLDYFSSRA
ncbi:MAG: 1,4-alpha-glucan branching protein domain-containing protein [Planctomycetota bacterium]